MTTKSSSLTIQNGNKNIKKLNKSEIYRGSLKELSQNASVIKEAFRSAQPFPHIVIDNFLEPELAYKVKEEFPKPEEMEQHGTNKKVLNGFQTNPREVRDRPALKAMFDFLESEDVRNLLQTICNSETEILCDPEYMGAGLLVAQEGGIHRVHRDRNRHPKNRLYARLVLVLYFNDEWISEYGGCFELWDKTINECNSIEPLFNRCIIFENVSNAYHGISDVHFPPGMTRKALNFYYYTAEIPKSERIMYIHDTDFFSRPDERLEYWFKNSPKNIGFNLIKAIKNKYQPLTNTLQKLKARLSGNSDLLKEPDQEMLKSWEVYNSKTPEKSVSSFNNDSPNSQED